MDEVSQFITEARNKGLNDSQIKQLLLTNGWTEAQAQTVLLGLSVPAAPIPGQGTSEGRHASSAQQSKKEEKSISALEAALQHVLLWVFTFTSSIMIGVVSFVLFGSDSNSSEALLTYLVVELVTFIPFLILFGQYLRQFRKQPDLKTGKVWSIITIVLHSLGLIGALTTFILVIVLVHDGDSSAVLASSAAIAVMNALVVGAYVAANFVKPSYRWRTRLLPFFPIALFILIAFFGVLALTRVGPLKADDETRQRLVDTTNAIKDETKDNKALPESILGIDADTEGISYKKLSSSTYRLCANFNKDTDSYSYGDDGPTSDDYISKYDFEGTDNGNQCFTLESSYLTSRAESQYYYNSTDGMDGDAQVMQLN